jgi:MFS family permease
MVYPVLLAAVGDSVHPASRATYLGVYRFWRDAGFAIGAILSGAIADLINARAAIWVVAALTLVSGVVVAIRMSDPQFKAAPESL